MNLLLIEKSKNYEISRRVGRRGVDAHRFGGEKNQVLAIGHSNYGKLIYNQGIR